MMKKKGNVERSLVGNVHRRMVVDRWILELFWQMINDG